jgi:hypothetical protein
VSHSCHVRRAVRDVQKIRMNEAMAHTRRVRKPKYTSRAAPPHSAIGSPVFINSGTRLNIIPMVTDTTVITDNDSTCDSHSSHQIHKRRYHRSHSRPLQRKHMGTHQAMSSVFESNRFPPQTMHQLSSSRRDSEDQRTRRP